MRHDISSIKAYVLLVFLLSVPFVAAGSLTGAQILPGVPVAGLAFVCPAVAGIVLARRAAGVRAFLGRAFDAARVGNKAWFLPVVLLYPAVVALSYVLLRLAGVPVPDPDVSLVPAAALAVALSAGALCEELGWSGHATEPLLARWGVPGAGLAVGLVWAVWHWVPLLQVGRTVSWIAWWSLGTVAARVIMVWLFARTGGSVFAMALFHTTLNLAWQLFPVNGSHFPVALVAVLMAGTAAAVVIGNAARRRFSGVRPVPSPPCRPP
ncbi:type II CAAX prenyl endopeptidase Rce1 family protein [Nonomuraea wenchangensis]